MPDLLPVESSETGEFNGKLSRREFARRLTIRRPALPRK